MTDAPRTTYHWHILTLSVSCWLLLSVAAAAAPRPHPIEVRIGEPSVWTLEQAHYLLARMHARSQDLSTQTPSPSDLDPSATHGGRIDILRTAFGASVGLDESTRLSNELQLNRHATNQERRGNVEAQLAERRQKLLELHRKLAPRRLEMTRLEAQDPPDDAKLDAARTRVANLEGQMAVLEQEIAFLTQELTAIDTSLPTLQAASAPTGAQLQGSALGKLIENAPSLLGSPRLHASAVLENHIEMQYELIAKQLTLLRDQTDPDEQILFLELPYSFYTVPKRADGYLAQVRWRVQRIGVLEKTPKKKQEDEERRDCSKEKETESSPCGDKGGGESAIRLREVLDAFKRTENDKDEKPHPFDKLGYQLVSARAGTLGRQVRIVDIIPRKSALNVTDIHHLQKGIGLTGQFLSVFGLGAKTNFERQREKYDQFLNQETFASGFGKGDRVYGWTIGPRPGTQKIAPGPRTTYAVLAVPRSTVVVEFEAEVCTYRRKQMPPPPFTTIPPTRKMSCSGGAGVTTTSTTMTVAVPIATRGTTTLSGFWVDEIEYEPVVPGQPATLIVRGERFSPQMGVLVEGVPLRHAVAIARRDFRHLSAAESGPGVPAVRGAFEIVNPETLAMVFTMGSNFEGTPAITLTSPFKTNEINSFHTWIRVQGRATWSSLKDESRAEPMFRHGLALAEARIRPGSTSGQFEGVLLGTGLGEKVEVSLNSQPLGNCSSASTDGSCELPTFSGPATAKWSFSATRATVRGQEEARLEAVDNPLLPSVDRARSEILHYDAGSSTGQSRPSTITVLVRGSGFESGITATHLTSTGTASPARVRPISSEELLISASGIHDPVLFELENPSVGAKILVSFTRPDAPTIVEIKHPDSGKAEGLEAGGYAVNILGEQLHNVKRVYFGTSRAKLLGAKPAVLQVTVPAGKKKVMVRLETDVVYRGSSLSNLADFKDKPETITFTYLPPPKDK